MSTHSPLAEALWKQRQEECLQFKASLDGIVNVWPARTALQESVKITTDQTNKQTRVGGHTPKVKLKFGIFAERFSLNSHFFFFIVCVLCACVWR